jgi:hypothetical protein
MEFAPAGEIIGEAHQVRTVRIADSDQIPNGDYRFIDMYCTDPTCDCRKTMIQVFHNDILVSTINFGWESRDFYQKWMGCPEDHKIDPAMHGVSIDIGSPDKVSPEGMLALFHALLDEKWIAKFKTHYAAVKKQLAETRQKEDDGSRTKRRTVRREARRP